jgi:hypothetical protein
MLPNEYTSLESAAHSVRDRMSSRRAGRFEAPPSWPRSRGPKPYKRRK